MLWSGLKAQRTLAAPSTTLTVTTTTDELVVGGTGCSLREAIMDANADSNTYPECGSGGGGAGTITLPAGTYTLAIAGTNENANATGDLDVTDAAGLVINGAGARSSIISANSIDRVLHAVAGATLTLNGVTLRDGQAATSSSSREGAGIQMWGASLTINDSRITQNINPAGNHDGAGINTGCSGCTIIIDRSLIDHNWAGDAGGGIDVPSNATVTIRNTTISNLHKTP
ncbi:MAG: hypothetical protein H6665_13180 [Ardenticatenaceae bacterium]|nr:hypothetical protein [Ardenticatenaceae bacterium]